MALLNSINIEDIDKLSVIENSIIADTNTRIRGGIIIM